MPEATGITLLRTAGTVREYARVDGFEISWMRAGEQDFLRHSCLKEEEFIDAIIPLTREQMTQLDELYDEAVTDDHSRDQRFLRILDVLRQAPVTYSVHDDQCKEYTGFNPDLESQFNEIDGYEPPMSSTENP